MSCRESSYGLGLVRKLRHKYSRDDKAVQTLYLKKPFLNEELIYELFLQQEMLEYIENARNAAERDFMTGTYNRRYFYDHIHQYYVNAVRKKILFSVAMLDIDHFTCINDTYGHDSGDKVIQSLANVLIQSVKGSDSVARFGGEEFCVVFKEITLEDTEKVMENIRKKVEALTVETDAGSITYTVSIGVTAKCFDTLDAMVNRACYLLYEAKDSGRNRVVVMGDIACFNLKAVSKQL